MARSLPPTPDHSCIDSLTTAGVSSVFLEHYLEPVQSSGIWSYEDAVHGLFRPLFTAVRAGPGRQLGRGFPHLLSACGILPEAFEERLPALG